MAWACRMADVMGMQDAWMNQILRSLRLFVVLFGGQEWFHDVPGLCGIKHALTEVQNGGTRFSLDIFCMFQTRLLAEKRTHVSFFGTWRFWCTTES